jgi:arginyl-tRNA synthetase
MKLVEEGKEKGVFEESDGAIVFRGESVGLHTRVFVTKEGLPTYETKDLGLAIAKKEYKPFDLSITTTAVEQKEYFKVVFEALARVKPETRGKYVSISHGMMQLQSGKMSSRKGNIITGESLLADMTKEALSKMEERDIEDKKAVAEVVGVAAIKYTVLKQSLGKNIIFDPAQALSFEGDSGPYLQYAHVRTHSLLRKAEAEGISPSTDAPTADVSEVEKLLIRFPEVVERATAQFEPHHVAQYLTELSAAFNSWYARERVIGSDGASYKLAVVDATRQTLGNGLNLLGIKAPEEM